MFFDSASCRNVTFAVLECADAAAYSYGPLGCWVVTWTDCDKSLVSGSDPVDFDVLGCVGCSWLMSVTSLCGNPHGGCSGTGHDPLVSSVLGVS